VHTPPPTPQSVPPAAPVWHVPLVRSQQPVLHSSVTPETTHAPLHECVVVSQAWLVGQSVTVSQPQAPAMHSLVPLQGPHAAPPVPHAALVSAVLQVPSASQHPVGHVVGVHVETHAPPVQVWLAAQDAHDTPPVPQLAFDETSHCPAAEQHPAAHVVGVQGTLASAPPSVAPPSVGAASTIPSPGASAAPSPGPSVVASPPPSPPLPASVVASPWPPPSAPAVPSVTAASAST